MAGDNVCRDERVLRAQASMSLAPVSQALTCEATLTASRPIVDPIDAAKDAFVDAWEKLKQLDLGDFVEASVRTVEAEPKVFLLAVGEGMFDYVKETVEGVVELGTGVVSWTSDAFECSRNIEFTIDAGVLADRILKSEACKPFHSMAENFIAIKDELEVFIALETAGIVDLVRELLPLLSEVLLDALSALIQSAGPLVEQMKAWLIRTSRAAQELGEVIGSLVASVLIEYATAGVARAMKGASVLSKLPYAVDAVGPDARSPAVMGARSMTIPVDRAALGRRRKKSKELDIFLELVADAMKKGSKKFNANLNLKRLAILRKHLKPEHYKIFLKQRARMMKAINSDFKKLKSKVGTYKDTAAEVEEFNRKILSFYYMQAAADPTILVDKIGVRGDKIGLHGEKLEILNRFFESNHIVEERVYEFFKNNSKWRKLFDDLGWKDDPLNNIKAVQKMDAVLMTSTDHTSSAIELTKFWKRAVREYDGSELDIDLPPKSLTKQLIEKFKLHNDLDPDQYLQDLAEFYKKEAPDYYSKTLRNTFLGWKEKLPSSTFTVP